MANRLSVRLLANRHPQRGISGVTHTVNHMDLATDAGEALKHCAPRAEDTGRSGQLSDGRMRWLSTRTTARDPNLRGRSRAFGVAADFHVSKFDARAG